MKKQQIAVLAMMLSGALFAAEKTGWEQAKEGFEKADAEMNQAFQRAIERIRQSDHPDDFKKAQEEDQRAAQRAWIQFRDAEESVVLYDWWGGAGAGAAAYTCKQKLTEERTEHLRQRYTIK